MVDLNCSAITDADGLCATFESTGVGIGVFLSALTKALPVLLIVFAVVGGIVLILGGIATAIKGSMTKVHVK